MTEAKKSYHQAIRRRVVKDFAGCKSRTKQSFKAECDINNIMAKYKRTGVLPMMIKQNPQYGDFANPVDFQDAMNIVVQAEAQFAGLPAKTRERFDNNPKNFLDFCSKKENREEMATLGLLNEDAMAALKREKQERFSKDVDAEIERRSKKDSKSEKNNAP